MNRVLTKFFNLPPHIKMMLALAGFGSMASIIFFILPALRSRQAKYWIIGIFVVGLLLFGIIYLIRRMFGKKKASALDNALESQGPTRGDIAEQEQIYKEKFKSKLTELKSNGLSVYKLPWFVLMGEPGSGKTATLINSGLDFPLGKDEVPGFGGTRNYNWWFTNNAVILDTAGRIAFQEEGTTDKVEWEYFIKLLKANRPRCPINGIIVAIPADRLLRDSSEEREQKATVLRERLRQVHQLLGVRFPTFVIVTKMDLVGGFNEFFDEIRPDLQQRNQMFGWSRPDEFQSSFDPATFMETFDGVYQRLRDWAMRYLQRAHATDQELGLVVTFPESFRQIRGALNDYIATIFQKSPLLEPPFFRGFYFTSSVQEGAPIFDVFAKSMGGSVVETRAAKAVDSKAFFIHDFYEKKVFPEQGLVFRSAKHVTLNKRMRRMVWMGSTAMAGLMLIFFLVGALNFRKLLTRPRADCVAAAKYIGPAGGAAPPTFADLPANAQLARDLSGHISQYRGALNALSARMMFPFATMSTPRGLVSQIHAKFVLVTILEPTLREFSLRIAKGQLPAADGRDAYLAALKTYALWYGETVGQGTWTQPMTRTTADTRAKQFEAILACLGGGLGGGEKQSAVEQVRLAFEYLADGRAFAADILKPHVPEVTDPATMLKVVSEIQAHYGPFTDVMGGAAGDQVQYWIDLFKKLGAARASYEALLALRSGFNEDFESAAKEFLRQTADIDKIDDYEVGPRAERGTFCQVWNGLAGFLDDNKQRLPRDKGRILGLRDLFSRVEKRWLSEFQPVEDALLVGAARDRTTEVEPVYKAIDEARASLKRAFDDSLAKLRKEIGISGDEDPLAYYVSQKLIRVSDARSGAAAASLQIDDRAFGQRGWLKSVLKELRTLAGGVESISEDLKDLSKWPGLIGQMKVQDPTQMESLYVRAWFAAVTKDTDAADNPIRRQKLIESAAQFQDGQTFWAPVALYDTVNTMRKARQDVYVGRTLRGMAKALHAATAADRLPGLARLRSGYDGVVADLPYEENEFNSRTAPDRSKPAERAQPKQETGGDLRGLRGQPTRSTEQPAENLGAQRSSSKLLVRYHTRKFLVETMRAFVQVDRALEGLPVADQGVKDAVKQAAEAYVDAYFGDWYAIYSDSSRLLDAETLALIRSCGDASYRWPQFEETINKNGFSIGRKMEERLAPLMKNAVFAGVAFVPGNADDDRAWPVVESRLNQLAASGKSLPSLLIRSFQGREDVALDYAGNLQKAWRAYVTQVSQFGPLAGENPAPGGPLPDVAKLRTSIIEGANIESSFPFVAPLTALASYGDKLLIYHLENKLATIVKPNHGKYPLLTRDDIPDPNRDEIKLRARVSNAIEPVRFLAMLRDLANFRKTYGELYKTAGSESGNLTLAKCEAWETFLYGKEGIPNDDPPALPKRIGVNVVPDPDNRPRKSETINPGSICELVCVMLPVLDGRGSHAAGEICVPTRGSGGAAAVAQDGWSYYWQLAANPGFQEARVWMKEFKVAGWKDEPAWTLPASPWALPLLLRSQEGDVSAGKVSIPVIFAQSGRRELGMYINIEFEGSFPGPIPLLADPEPVRGMAAAPALLTGKGGG